MKNINDNRRRILTVATSFVAGAGVAGLAVPFVQSWNPSAKVRSSGAPVKVNVSKIDPGAIITVDWQRKPVWVLRRSKDNLEELEKPAHKSLLRDPDSAMNQQPDYAKNDFRSIRPEIFIAVGICTHLGCIPLYKPEGLLDYTHGLYFCPCHGSKFDLAGRVFKGVPAPTNLIVPPHRYITGDVVEIGVDGNTLA